MNRRPPADVKRQFKRYLAPRLGGITLDAGAIEQSFTRFMQETRLIMSRGDEKAVLRELICEIVGYGPLAPLFADDKVTEIMVNGAGAVYAERAGIIDRTNITFQTEGEVINLAERMIGPLGCRVDESTPFADARLPDGSRVNVIIPPLALDGPCVTVRRFPDQALSVADLVENGTMSGKKADFLRKAVAGKRNMVISGGTGSGKTTLLNALSSFIPKGERLITIEDAAELRLQNEHVVRLEGRIANVEGTGEVTARDLVRNALRMRPDRIIVGEVRGPEALDMLQAMNTGHEGSLTTVHANSPEDAIRRLEVMVMMADVDLPHRTVREHIFSALDFITHIARLPDGRRRVTGILDVKQVS